MEELFTVDWALNFEGWQYDKNVEPYNYYTLGEFNIKVRRNDFFLVLFIRNACDELVFAGRIYTKAEYKSKIKKNLTKWKCRNRTTNVTPGPPPPPEQQPLTIIPFDGTVVDRVTTINVTYPLGYVIGPFPSQNFIAYVYNEDAIPVSDLIYGNMRITVVNDGGQLKVLLYTDNNDPISAPVGLGSAECDYRGAITGTIVTVVINFNITTDPPASILLEQGEHILTESGSYIIRELN